MRYRSVLFDLDGTLTDSGPGIKNCIRYAYQKLNLTCPGEEELNTFVGPPLPDSFRRYGVCEEKILTAVSYFHQLYNQRGKYENEIYPGIENMLKMLNDKGLSLYVATSKPQALAEEILDHFSLSCYFEGIVGSDGQKKVTKANVIASLSNIVKKPAVMAGDTVYDIIGAQANHMPCIFVTWGYGKEETIADYKETMTVHNPDELLQYLL